jgi:hypothetical protein
MHSTVLKGVNQSYLNDLNHESIPNHDRLSTNPNRRGSESARETDFFTHVGKGPKLGDNDACGRRQELI